MDFSALLNKEIAKKKEEAASVSGGAKYLSRGEAEKERERKYLQEQQENEKRREEKLKRARQEEEEEREEKRKRRERRLQNSQSEDSSAEKTDESAQSLPDLSKQEVKSRLRQLDEPVTIFGESDVDRLKRMLKAERKQQKKVQIDQEDNLPVGDMAIAPQSVRDDQTTVNLQIRAYLKYLISKWDAVLNERKDEAGEQAFSILHQTQDNINLLLNKLRRGTLHDDIFVSLATLTMYLQQKNYQQANDAYIKMSIGNAAWPIGVTAVGIHARAAQEKITGKDQFANIMKSEDTRRWLTAVKRLVTFAEGHNIGL